MVSYDLYIGDALEQLRLLDDEIVDTCITSPPYYGLRDYGADRQLGLEDSAESFIQNLVEVFREVRRVLKPDGTLWVNIGDSYSGSGKGRNADGFVDIEKIEGTKQETSKGATGGYLGKRDDFKPKDLMMIPAMLAIALRADGWYLRQDIIWAKPNPMPEPVKDRCTKAHEYIFLLSKNRQYYYDAEAIRENPDQVLTRKGSNQPLGGVIGEGRNDREMFTEDITTYGRNKRSVWTVTTKGFKEAHFATYPPDLIEPCILAGTSQRGCCPECGKAWNRIVERIRTERTEIPANDPRSRPKRYDNSYTDINGRSDCAYLKTQTLGWEAGCDCDAGDPIPAVVLDPFSGSGTTAGVALKHGRNAILIELNPEYAALTSKRMKKLVGWEVDEGESVPVKPTFGQWFGGS